jgi:hypothetical protein
MGIDAVSRPVHRDIEERMALLDDERRDNQYGTSMAGELLTIYYFS